jgi:hypothetical protein
MHHIRDIGECIHSNINLTYKIGEYNWYHMHIGDRIEVHFAYKC